MDDLCHCGKPLHYTCEKTKQMVDNLIDKFGRYMEVTSIWHNKTYKVDRHYIALHGIKEALLHTYGFEEVK